MPGNEHCSFGSFYMISKRSDRRPNILILILKFNYSYQFILNKQRLLANQRSALYAQDQLKKCSDQCPGGNIE